MLTTTALSKKEEPIQCSLSNFLFLLFSVVHLSISYSVSIRYEKHSNTYAKLSGSKCGNHRYHLHIRCTRNEYDH